MEPVRPTYWNVPGWAEILVYILGFLAIIIFAHGFYRHVKKWKQGKPERVKVSIFTQLRSLMKYAVFQWRLASDPFALAMHLMIFWGMVILLIGTIVATVDWDVTHLLFGFQILKGYFYFVFELVLDIFGIMVILGLVMAIYRRWILHPVRLEIPEVPTFRLDSFYLLGILLLIVLTGYIQEGLRISAQNPSWGKWAPVGYSLSSLFDSLPTATTESLHFFFWSLHLLCSLVFIAGIPYSKAFHIFSSPISIYLGRPAHSGKLNISDDSGVEKIGDFTWRELLQMDACTWCGRCQDKCPAYTSGFSLSPKNLILKLNAQSLRSTKRNGAKSDPKEEARNLHGSVISSSELWACTTCLACEETCPVFVEHPRMIIELRRHLVSQGEVEKNIQDTLMKVNRYGNSFGQSDRSRGKWTQGLEFKIKDARKEQVDYLWILGDYASFDSRIQDITRTTAKIFQKVGLDFGILFEGEKNSGNDMRRIGEEGLYNILKEKNIQAIKQSKYKYIITTDPHTYNTLKNEYGMNGRTNGDNHVLHYTEIFDHLIRDRRLKLTKKLNYSVTYHDPCYLGRYNGVYDAPRRVLNATGIKLVEMPRNRARSYCCGAGGGRIWMEDEPGIKERTSESRVREAVSLGGVQSLVVACPKDTVMFQDALKTTASEGKIGIKDISELVYEAID